MVATRAEPDRAALRPLPADDYAVTDRHLRRVGKDRLISFASSRYSIPARLVRAGMSVELRVGPDTVAVHATGADPVLLAEHRRARHKGDDQIDPPTGTGCLMERADGSSPRLTSGARPPTPRTTSRRSWR